MIYFHKLFDFHSDLCYSFLVDNVNGTLDMEDCIYRNRCVQANSNEHCPCRWYKTLVDEIYESEIGRFSEVNIDEVLYSYGTEPEPEQELNFDEDQYKGDED